MRYLQIKFFVYTVFIWLSPCICFSQQDTIDQKQIRLTLTDGSEFIGTVVHEDSSVIILKTQNNISMTIPRVQVKTSEVLSEYLRDGMYIRRDPNDTRLFFAPTGRSLKKGQGYFSAYEIFFPSIAVGVTDYLMFAGGISLIPGAERQLLYFTPKLRLVHVTNFDLSAALQYMNSFGYSFGLSYGIATYGTSRASITGGLGWGFVDGEFSNSPVLILGGEAQLSNSIKFITENWFPPKADVAIISFGIRFFGENIAGDFGLMTTTKSGGGFPFFPWLGFAYNFGATN